MRRSSAPAISLFFFYRKSPAVRPIQKGLFSILFFLFLFGFGGGVVWGQTNPEDEVPEYEWLDSEDMGTAGISSLDNLIIAMDTDSRGNIYALAFGGKILKFDQNGNPKGSFQLKDEFEGLVDMAINFRDEIFVAHYEGREVLAFDLEGNPLSALNEETDYFKPLGLAFDENDNLYVVEYNDGTGAEDDVSSRLKIYSADGSESPALLEDELVVPYRIAVDSNGFILISHASEDGLGEVKIFKNNLEFYRTLSGIGSPGSIEIDPFGFIHVIDYSDELDLSRILNRDYAYLITHLDDIRNGINDEEFVIRIFSPEFVYEDVLVYKLDLPLDIAFGSCDKVFVNNANLEGLSLFSKLQFDLEIYKRTPSFDVEIPTVDCIEPGKEFKLVAGSVTITVEDIDDNSTDNCAIESKTLSEDTFTTLGEKEITLTVTDAAGNTNFCTTTIIVVGEEEPETTFECKDTFTLQLDSNGQASLSPEDLYTGEAEGVNFSLSKENFTCSDIGTKSVILNYSGAATGTCTIQVKVEDLLPPKVECPTPNYVISYEGEKKAEIPDFSGILKSSDNCTENLKFIQDPPPGTNITQDTWVKFYAEDEGGAQSGCAFWVVLKDERKLTISCLGDKIYNPGADCGTTMPDFLDEISVNIPEATVTQSPEPGFPVHGSIDVKFTAVYEDQSFSCTLKYISEDITPPELVCVENQNETIDPDEGFQLPNYILELDASDNCYIAKFQQIPEVGTVIYKDTEVRLIATDGSDNVTECSFLINIEEEESPLEISCPPDKEVTLGSNCSFEIHDYTILAEINIPEAQISQQPEIGEIVQQDTEITLFATFEGETVECSFKLKLIDTFPPTIICPENQTRNFDPEVGFSIPDFTGLVSVDDTCGVDKIVQTPAEGTLIFEDEEIEITVSDNFGNEASCSFQLFLTEKEILEISCPPTQLVEPTEENCGFIVQDYRNLAQLNKSGAAIIQNPEPGTVLFGSSEIILTVTFADETASCSFQVDVKDITNPIAKCVENYTLKISPGEIKTINAEDLDDGSSDACGEVSFRLSKNIFSEADAGKNIVDFIVTDESGNEAVCEVKVMVVIEDPDSGLECKETLILELDENGSTFLTAEDLYAGNDPDMTFSDEKLYFYCDQIGEHQIGLVDPDDPENTCTTTVIVLDKLDPVANCASSLSVRLNADGKVTVSPRNLDNGSYDNCGIASYELSKTEFTTADLGSNPVTFTVFDSSGNSDVCQAEIIIQEYEGEEPGDFSCVSPVTVYLDENGSATVENSSFYEGEIPENAEISVDKNTFSCEDLPETMVNLIYKYGADIKTCEIKVNVEDTLKPVISVSNISLELDENGNASLSPEKIDKGTFDNCGISQLNLSKTSFGCENIGENKVIFTAKDSNGNTASAEVDVTISDPDSNCNIGPVEPPEGGSYVIVYPNPGEGLVNIETSADIDLYKAEVFDMRGRFLTSKKFENPASHDYNIDLRQLQSGVYTLKLYSETEEFIRRVIISTY